MDAAERLDSYEIFPLLGRGGMEIWRARDAKRGREVAIKTFSERHRP